MQTPGVSHRHILTLALAFVGVWCLSVPALAWTPPIGIPAPSFGIDQTVGDATYTHWVDNSGSCSDSTNGTPASPRCSVPSSVGPGAVIQVRGGPYAIGDLTWTMSGTQAQPVFVRGPATGNRPAFKGGDLRLVGTYFIVENIDLSAPAGGNNGRVYFDGSGTHHAALRYSYIHDAPDATGAAVRNDRGNDIVFFGNEIARIGIIPDGRDVHGVWTNCGTQRVWILENHIHHNGGDAIQFGHGCWSSPPGAASVYIGRNHMHEDEENAIDIKETLGPVVISENTIWGYRPGQFSGNGDAIRLNDEGAQGEIWILNNRIYNSTICINPSQSDAESYILGNKLWDCLNIGIGDKGKVKTVVANNTVVNTPRGIDGGSEVRGNIVSKASSCHICTGVSGCSNNLVWQPGGTPVVQVSCASGVQGDPLMLTSGNEQVGLQGASPAIEAGYAHSAYAYYEATYGLNISRDPAGTARPQGVAWDIGAYEGVTGGLRSLAINDVVVTEGNAGSTTAQFTISLSTGSTQTVSVNYSTANGTAQAGSDYVAASGTVTFTPGSVQRTLNVTVNGDTTVEPDETFFVNLSSPTNATLADAQGTGTIRNDDTLPLPALSINDVTVTEGNSGTVNAVFTVSLSASSSQTVSVVYATANGTATAGSDYVAQTGNLSFSPGQTSKTVNVTVNGDTAVEPDETFFVNLSSPTNGALADAQGLGTIRNDDSAPPPPPPPSGGQPVVWTAAVGVSVSGSSLTKTAGTAWGNAGAVSTQSIASGDGWVEFTATETSTHRMLGLSNGNADQSYQDIDFAIYPAPNGMLAIYEKGANRGTFTTYASGDKLRVAVQGGVVKYSKNGTVIYTSTMAPTYPLLVDTSLYTTGATVTNAIIGTGTTPPPPPPPPSGGQPVVWTSAVGVSVSGSSLAKTAATAWGNAGAVSTQSIASGDGWVEFTVTENNTHRMLGLSNGDTNQNWDDIDFGLYLNADTRVQVYERGVYRGAFGNHVTGDRMRVSVQSGAVKYLKNGTVLYTSPTAPTYPLLVDTSLYTIGSTLTSATIGTGAPPPSGAQAVVWTSAAGVSVAANSLTKTAGTAWGNAGAVSTQAIASGDGYVEFTATEINTHRMLGLSNGNTNLNWDDIDFGLYLNANALLEVYERGAYRGKFGNYYAGDRLQVSVQSGVVKYLKNGTVFYTSPTAPTYPLLVDTSLYTSGATLTNAMISAGGGTAPPPPASEGVAWTAAGGVSISGNSLTKSAGTAWGNAGAVSTKSLTSGDGWVEFTVTETNTHRMLGLSNGNTNLNWDDIDFGLYLNADTRVEIYERGVYRGAFGNYAAGDRMRVSVQSGVVKYLKNGTAFYASATAPTYPLLVDTSLYTIGATLTNDVIGGGDWR